MTAFSFDNEERIFRIPDFSPETRLGRGRGLSTKELGTVQTQSPYRDLKSDLLSASVKSIRVSGALTHRDIARVFAAYKEPLDACKNRFPDLSHTLLFAIEPSKNIKPTGKITAFSKCAFRTIYKMNFLSASDGQTVAVQIRL